MKKGIIITLAIAITTCVGTGLATYFVVQHQANERYNDLAKRVFEMHYNERCVLFEEENKHLSNVDVSFIGDSLTEGYDIKRFYSQYNVVNRGISGDTTFGVEKRLKNSAYDVNPKVATLLIGANNFDTMFENYEKILQGFKDNIPNTKIVLLSQTSMTKEWGRNNKKAQQNNVKIKEFADKYNYTYVDLYNLLLDESTNELKLEYTTDGGHFTEEGYVKVTSIITPVLEQLLGY